MTGLEPLTLHNSLDIVSTMPKPIYLLHGEEGVLISEELRRLKTELAIDPMSIEMLEGAEVDVSQIAQAIQSTPMLFAQGQKLVIIRDLPLFKTGKADKDEGDTDKSDDKETETQYFVSLLENLNDDTTVIFTFEESSDWKNPRKVDKRRKFYKTIKKLGAIQEFNRFADWDTARLSAWVRERVQKEGKTITQDANQALCSIVGGQLGMMSLEIQKLVTYLGERSEIKVEDVLTLTSAGQIASFALVNALRDKDFASAIKALRNMLYYGENEVALLNKIVSQFRTLLQIRYLQDQKTPYGDATRIIGGHPYAIKLLFEAAKKFKLAELKDIFQILAEADYKLKTGQLDKEVILEMIITDICEGSRGSVLLESMLD